MSCPKLTIESIGSANRIPFPVKWDVREVVHPKNRPSVAVRVCQTVGGGNRFVYPNYVSLCLGLAPYTDRTSRRARVRKVIIISVEIPVVEKCLPLPCTDEIVGRVHTWNFRQHRSCECYRSRSKCTLHSSWGSGSLAVKTRRVCLCDYEKVRRGKAGRLRMGQGSLKSLTEVILFILGCNRAQFTQICILCGEPVAKHHGAPAGQHNDAWQNS